MRKSVSSRSDATSTPRRRVLARVLAQNMEGVTGGAEPVMVTQLAGRKDITNVSADSDQMFS